MKPEIHRRQLEDVPVRSAQRRFWIWAVSTSSLYEPLWAIGSLGHQATPEQAENTHATIRRKFAQMFGEQWAQALLIQYGGSMKPGNAAALLVGGASLEADQFLAIIQAGVSHSERKGKAA